MLDREPRLTEPAGAPALPPGNGHVQLQGVTLRYDDPDEFGAAYSADERLATAPTAATAGSAPRERC